jgi:hypothetical protein
MGIEKDAAVPRKRGKNWTEADSLKLIDAYQFVQFNKLGIHIPPNLLMPLESDNAGIIIDKIASRFAENCPNGDARSTEAVKERWKKLLETYRFAYPLLFH